MASEGSSLTYVVIEVLLVIQAGIRISSVHKRPAPDKKENIVKKATVALSRSEVFVKEATSEGTPSWASDHNYNAVKPEQTAAPWPPLLYKCMYHLGVAPGPFPVSLDSRHLGLSRARSFSRI